MWTVYIHTNKINDKKYVGITSCPVKRRWKNGYGYSDSLPIGKAIRKYGWDNFEHKIIAEGLTEDEAKQMEVDLIAKFDTTNIDYGYNLTAGGDGICGFSFSDETKKKQSEAAKRLNRFGEKNPNYGHKWSEEKKAESGLAHKRENLSEETLRKMSEAAKKRTNPNPFLGKHHTKETRELFAKQKSKPVLMFSKDGEFIMEFDSVLSAAFKTNINKVSIGKCCRGEMRSCGGYVWKYKNEINNN